MVSDKENSLILETSLQTFFFDQLLEVNKKFLLPLPAETIFYSSLVMDRFGLSKDYFEVVDGRVREKALGIKLLESANMTAKQQQRNLKDIGDTALFLCGYFSESVHKKITDIKYYRDIGQMAYSRLNAFMPAFYDIDSFYTTLASQFDALTNIMRIMQRGSQENYSQDPVYLVLNESKLRVS